MLSRPTTEEASVSYKIPDLQVSRSKAQTGWSPSTIFHPTPVQPTVSLVTKNRHTPPSQRSMLPPCLHNMLPPSRQLDSAEPVTLSPHIPVKSRISSVLRNIEACQLLALQLTSLIHFCLGFSTSRPVSSRILTPMRRHMASSPLPSRSLPTPVFSSHAHMPTCCLEDTRSTTRQ